MHQGSTLPCWLTEGSIPHTHATTGTIQHRATDAARRVLSITVLSMKSLLRMRFIVLAQGVIGAAIAAAAWPFVNYGTAWLWIVLAAAFASSAGMFAAYIAAREQLNRAGVRW